MHWGAMNRVRSEEAALSRSPECRGKPGLLILNGPYALGIIVERIGGLHGELAIAQPSASRAALYQPPDRTGHLGTRIPELVLRGSKYCLRYTGVLRVLSRFIHHSIQREIQCQCLCLILKQALSCTATFVLMELDGAIRPTHRYQWTGPTMGKAFSPRAIAKNAKVAEGKIVLKRILGIHGL